VTGDPRRRKSGGRERDVGGNGTGSPESQAQRERLINAFTRVASERGYSETTAADVATVAGLPDNVFYEHFESKRQCLSAAHDAFFGRMMSEAADAIDPDDDWPTRVRDGVTAMLEFVDETFSRARFFAVEALAAGPLILERQAAEIERVVPMLREGRRRYPAAADLPELTELLLVGGAAYVVRASLLSEGPLPVKRLETELVEILLGPYLGSDEARRVAG
jgi:AcrR family transcriptional regulator